VLSYSDHFVRNMIERSNDIIDKDTSVILDPFLGTGTTTVEAMKLGYKAIGIEANPICVLASRVKSNWSLDPVKINDYLAEIGESYFKEIRNYRININTNGSLNSNDRKNKKPLLKIEHKLLNEKYISPIPWTKINVLKQTVTSVVKNDNKYLDMFLLILAKTFRHVANVKFAPEISYIKPKPDAEVFRYFKDFVTEVMVDLKEVADARLNLNPVSRVICGDSRFMGKLLDENEQIDLVITSPPYPVDKDYTRITRLESSILGLTNDLKDVRNVKDLKSLNLSYNRIESIPKDFEKLENLERLNLSNNLIKTIPKNIEGFQSLTELDLSMNKIKKLPDNIGNLKNLKKLNIGWSYVNKLPKSMGNLKNLEELHIGVAPIEEIPSAIGDLESLKVVSVYGGLIKKLPKNLCQRWKDKKVNVRIDQYQSYDDLCGE
jgi:DNA modification methylase